MICFESRAEQQKQREFALSRLCRNAGFFPETQEMGFRFSEWMQEACAAVDVLGVWNIPYQDYVIERYMNHPALVRLAGLEPFFSQRPWTRILKGKKVLVIHPFEDTIQRQYEKRKLLFANEEILPDFQLRTVRAVQTMAGQRDERFQTWFEALDWMQEEALKTEFDIALIGCGAYGFPLAQRLKRAGRQAVHIGGALQLFFGIQGKRWDNAAASQLYNEYWVRPSAQERVERAAEIENGCYW